MKCGFFGHFLPGDDTSTKPEGFTEYSRRQSPRPLRAPPPVGIPPKTIRPERAKEFFANLKLQQMFHSTALSVAMMLCDAFSVGWFTGTVNRRRRRKRRWLCRRLYSVNPSGFVGLPYLIAGSSLPAPSPERLSLWRCHGRLVNVDVDVFNAL